MVKRQSVRIQLLATNDPLRAAGETVILFDYTISAKSDQSEELLISVSPQTLQMALGEYQAYFVKVTSTPDK